jgi:tetratricopeptide (TPR) repeat protein
MKRELNVRFFAFLIGATAFLAVGVHFLHGHQVKRNAKLLLDQALRAEEKGQLNQASELLSTYLVYVPDDQETLAKYGFLLEGMSGRNPAMRVRAFMVLEKALRLDPGNQEVRRRAVRMAMDLGRYSDALEHLKFLPDDSQTKQWIGQCQEAENHFELARKSYEEARDQDPKQVRSYLSLAMLLHRHLNLPSEAEKVMEELAAKNPDSFSAFLARANYFKEFKDPKRAAEAIEQARKLAPDESDVIVGAAELQLTASASQNFDSKKITALLERGLELYPQDARLYLLMAQSQEQSQHRPEAIAVLRRAAKAIPQNADILWRLADFLLAEGVTAREEITGMRQLGVSPTRLDFLEARALINDQKCWEAIQKLERIRPDLENQPVLLLQTDLNLGLAYGQVGEPDQQYDAFRRAAKTDPASAAACQGMISALFSLGRTQEAIDLSLTRMSAAPEAAIAAARLIIQNNLRLPENRRQWDRVNRVLDECKRITPAPADLPILEAECQAARGQLDKAREVLEQAIAQGPDRVEFWVALADLADRGKNSDRALSLLDQAQAKFGDKIEIRLGRVSYWAKRKGETARQALAKLDTMPTNFSPNDQAILLRGLTRAYVQLGDARQAGKVLQRWGDLRPWDLGIQLLLLDLALQDGDESMLLSTIQHLKELEGPEGAWWRYAQACHLIWQVQQKKAGDLEEAGRLLAEASGQKPNSGRIVRRLGDIDDWRGETSSALKNYLRAIELGEREVGLIRRSVELLYARNRIPEALDILQRLPEGTAASSDLQRLAAQVYMQAHDFRQACESAEKAVSSQSTDYRDHLWLGQILDASAQAQNQPAERDRLAQQAEKAFRQAAQLSGDVPDPWVALISFLARTGFKRDAETTLQEMTRHFSPDKTPLPLAYAHEATGQIDKARQLYQKALATLAGSNSKDEKVLIFRAVAGFFLRMNQAKEAEPLLQQLMALKVEAPEESAWAKRILSVILSNEVDYSRKRQALALLGMEDENIPPPAASESPEDLRAKALVLASQSRSSLRRRAIPLLENLMERQTTAEDQFLLAQLYESAEDWAKAKLRFTSLLASNNGNPRYWAAYALALLRHQELVECRTCLDKLTNLPETVDAFVLTEIQSRLSAAQRNSPDALKRVQSYVDGKTSEADLDQRLERAALLLETLHQAFPAEKDLAGGAEKLHRQHAQRHPEKALLLAAFLGRQGRCKEALDICSEAWQKCPAAEVALTTMSVLHQGSVDPSQFDRVDGWFKEAMAKDPKVIAALMVFQADLRLLQGRDQEAVSLYRQVLEHGSRNPTALNNLAWILALKQGKGDEALQFAQQALQITGPNPALLDTRGVIYLTLGRAEQAIQDLQTAVEERPTATYCFHLARAQAMAQNLDKAKEAFQKAKDLGLAPDRLDQLERGEYAKLGLAVGMN